MNMLERLRQIAEDAGLDADEALDMTVLDFMRAVSERRAAARMGLECTCGQGKFASWCPVHNPKPADRSEWLSNVLRHCDRASRSMSVLVRERKAVTS